MQALRREGGEVEAGEVETDSLPLKPMEVSDKFLFFSLHKTVCIWRFSNCFLALLTDFCVKLG